MSMDGLKYVSVGDAVAVMNSAFSGNIHKRAVTKLTKTQAVLDDGSRWLRRNGNRIGASAWSREYAKPFDQAEYDEVHAELEQKQLADMVAQLRFTKLSTDQMRRILAICKEKQGNA